MEVFPEEVALKYGVRPDQKVVNIVTFDTFSSRIIQTNLGYPTDGGADQVGASGTVFSIRKSVRISLATEVSTRRQLLENQRGIEEPATAGGPSSYRTLLPSADNISVNGTVGSPILSNVDASISASVGRDRSRNILGLVDAALLTRNVSTDTLHLGGVLSGRSGEWLWSAIGNYDRTTIGITGELLNLKQSAGEAESFDKISSIDVTASGPVLDLPAGAVRLGIRAALGSRSFVSRSWNDGLTSGTALPRNRSAVQANLDVPITNAQKGASPLGRLAANANAAWEKMSDFKTLKAYGYSLYWTPIELVNLYATVRYQEDAPTVEQLGASQIQTPNVPTFDFVRGETVDVIRLAGGNNMLRSERRRAKIVGLYAKPLRGTDFTVSFDYTYTKVDDPVAMFPIATAAIERAFPERFTRDGDGRLVLIDGRPLNFERSTQSRLRSGLTFTKPLGKGPPLPKGTSVSEIRYYPNEAAMRAATPPGLVTVEVAPGSADADRIEAMASRVTVSLFHTFNLEDTLIVRQGSPVLDLMKGAATDLRGGTPRHVLSAQVGVFKGGIGARVTADWRSGTTVFDLPAESGGIGNLRFSDYAIINVNLFATPSNFINGRGTSKLLSGLRASINITNLFNTRPRVVDQLGNTPFMYKSAYLDPIGCVVRVSIRKKF
ncbi:TonB-dependent receptor [Sphingomonas sp. MA1305]|uniref:TonB-dependent receptor n=1 Tax=Sphingomonas sp. MA1305 TaxID=2479204 RepID=UPI0018DFD4E2|nr:TonB-dependent receptor [Sphingomonas sp. MA1305]MBI0475268.1 TonB-dependent receptor [Sphingomonas sp. MA1305]